MLPSWYRSESFEEDPRIPDENPYNTGEPDYDEFIDDDWDDDYDGYDYGYDYDDSRGYDEDYGYV